MISLRTILESELNSPILSNQGQEGAWIFVVIKPGFLKYAQDIIEQYTDMGWKLKKTRTKQLLLNEAKKLYAVHKKEDFYEDLCKYMSSGESMALIFANKLLKISDDMFKQTNEIKDIIREKYGESDMRNVVHSSDSYQAMLNESSIYF